MRCTDWRSLVKNWVSRSRSARRTVAGGIEQLQSRTLLTTTVFLDFGIDFPLVPNEPAESVNRTLTTTVAGMRDGILGMNQGPDLSVSSSLDDASDLQLRPVSFDFNEDGTVNTSDLKAMGKRVGEIVAKAFEPYDIAVVVADAASEAEIATFTGGHDAYVILAGVTSSDNVATPVENDAVNVGVELNALGIAARLDLDAGQNNTGELALTFADLGIVVGDPETTAYGLAHIAAHEAAHTLGLRHTWANSPLANSDQIQDGAGPETAFIQDDWYFTNQELPLHNISFFDFIDVGPVAPPGWVTTTDVNALGGSHLVHTGPSFGVVAPFDDVTDGTQEVFVSWIEDAGHSTAFPFEVLTNLEFNESEELIGSDSLGIFTVDQRVAPSADLILGSTNMQSLGFFDATNGIGVRVPAQPAGLNGSWDLVAVQANVNSHQQLIDDANIGFRDDYDDEGNEGANGIPDLAFVTGNGLHDHVYVNFVRGKDDIVNGETINRPVEIDVIVDSYSDAARSQLVRTRTTRINNDEEHSARNTDGLIRIDTGPGNDLIDLTALAAHSLFTFDVNAGAGDDVINGSKNIDTLRGGTGNDTIHGNVSRDSLFGGTGNDELYGGSGDDTLHGGLGQDTLTGGSEVPTTEASGDDTYRISEIEGIPDGLIVTDIIVEKELDGASDEGEDWLDFTGIKVDLLIDLKLNLTRGPGFVAGDELATGWFGQIENVRGGAGNDSLSGDVERNSIEGGEGQDVLTGRNGADTLFGGMGNDTLRGGTSADVYLDSFDRDFTISDSLSLPTGIQRAGTIVSIGPQLTETDLFEDEDGVFRLLVYGGASNNTLDARGFNTPEAREDLGDMAALNSVSLFGGLGNDTLYGSRSNDKLLGGGGNDSLYGEAGHDTLLGASGKDRIFGGDGDDSALASNGDDTIDGGDGNDTLKGENGNDSIVGNDGDDSILGKTGDDTLVGGDGNDTIRGDDGNDLMLGGGGDDSLDGGQGNDSLGGGSGNDNLNGKAGDDIVVGEAGNDTLRGDFGLDLLVANLDDPNSGTDEIIADDSEADTIHHDNSDTINSGSEDTLTTDQVLESLIDWIDSV